MAGLNIAALKGVQEDLNKRTSGGGNFLYAKDIQEETDFRLLPPPPHMNGLYFLEVITFWINGQKYISPKTFGLPCVMTEIVEEIEQLAKKDKGLSQLLESDKFSKKSEFWIAGLLLECKFEGNEATEVNVVDDKAKILSAGTMLLKAINRVVTSRNYQNGTPDGIADREKGFNIVLSKTGKKLDTVYDAQGWLYPTEMDEKYYKDIPDVVAIAKKDCYDDTYLEAVINNYFYGDAMPKEKAHRFTAEETEEKAAPARPSRTAAKAEEKTEPAARSSRRAAPAEAAAESPRPSRKSSAAAAENTQAEGGARPSRRSAASGTGKGLLDAIEDLD